MDQQVALPVDVEEVGDVRVYRMTLPYVPPSKNQIDAWPVQWKSSAKKKWSRDMQMHCTELQIPKGLHRVGLAATLVFPTKTRRDPQNYAQTLWHWVPDALVRCGVLLDDHAGCIEIGANWGLKFQVDDRKHVPKQHRKRTVLTVAVRVVD
jgi:hypothetical protein